MEKLNLKELFMIRLYCNENLKKAIKKMRKEKDE